MDPDGHPAVKNKGGRHPTSRFWPPAFEPARYLVYIAEIAAPFLKTGG